jgi:uncharacterized protein (DUF1697 family)
MTAKNSYLVLLRGINVGGKNKLPMAALKAFLEGLGFDQVQTYIQSGNAIVQSSLSAAGIAGKIEKELGAAFTLDSDLIKVLVLSRRQLKPVVDNRPKGFGDAPDKYHSDAIFLMGLSPKEALTAFSPLDGVDTLWAGKGVIYSQRLSAKRTKSRLMASPLYKSMTIRTWGTVIKLLDML